MGAIAETDLALVCVGTPSRGNGSIDLGYVRRVCEQIGQALRGRETFFTVVIRSTVASTATPSPRIAALPNRVAGLARPFLLENVITFSM